MSGGHTARWLVADLQQQIRSFQPCITVEVLPEIDSTNAELMRRARAGCADPILLVAEHQTAGRGRIGRPWQSASGASLTFSLGLPMAAVHWSGLSLVAGIAVAESLQAAAIATGAGPARQGQRLGLKWPNDVWLSSAEGDGKMAGILVQTRMPSAVASEGDEDKYVVLGIGINIRPVAESAAQGMDTPPACLQQFCPGMDAPCALLHVTPALVEALLQFEQRGFASFARRFEACDILRGRSVKLQRDGLTTDTGVACGVDHQGALLVRTSQGMRTVASAEVSVRPQSL